MFVLVLARGLPSPRSPHWGIFELDQARALRAAGHRVAIAALDLRSARRMRRLGLRHRLVDGTDVHTLSLPIGPIPGGVDQAALDAGFELLWSRVVASHGTPDVVHAHFTRYGLAAARSRHRSAFRLVVTERDPRFSPQGIPVSLRRSAAEAFRGADAVLAVSEALSEVISAAFDLPVPVVPDIVDVDSFAGRARREHDGIRLVSVGSLVPRKRMDLLVDGFARAFSGRPEVRLAVLGKGAQREQLEAAVTAAGLQGRVELLGHQSRSRIAEEFSRSDGFVLLSQWEVFGVVFVEAMGAGLPVLSSRCGGPEGFLHEGVGMFADTTDVAAAARSLERFVRHFPDWDAEHIRAESRRVFTPACVAAQLTDVYARACSQ